MTRRVVTKSDHRRALGVDHVGHAQANPEDEEHCAVHGSEEQELQRPEDRDEHEVCLLPTVSFAHGDQRR